MLRTQRLWYLLSSAATENLLRRTSYQLSRLCNLSTAPPSGHATFNAEKDLHVPEYFNFANDVIDEWASDAEASKRTAFWYVTGEGPDLKWSFADLSAESQRAAAAISSVCEPKRVLMVLPKIPEWWLFNIAASRTDSILFPGTTQLMPKDFVYRLQMSEVDCVITDSVNADKIDSIDDGSFKHLKTKIIVNTDGKTRKGWIDFASLMNDSRPEFPTRRRTRSDDICQVFFTSGTTGRPKMVAHTHASYGIGHVVTAKSWLDLTKDDLLWNLADTGWAKSAYSSVYSPWIVGAGAFIHKMPRFDPNIVLSHLCSHPVSVMCAPPTAMREMLQNPPEDYKFNKLRRVVSGGEPVNPEIIESWEKLTGIKVNEGYGQTETTMLAIVVPGMEIRQGSMGKAAPGYDIRIVDDFGEELPIGEEGNIGIKYRPDRPVGLFKGYLDDEAQMEKVFIGDYYFPGDLAKMDKDGYIWFVGRNDDVITSSGYRIGPFEVESALLEHPAVLESAAVSSPDPLRHEVVKAFIVLTEGYKNVDQEKLIKELQDHVKKTTAPYKYPRKVEFVESLPKTISGKILRKQLRYQEWVHEN